MHYPHVPIYFLIFNVFPGLEADALGTDGKRHGPLGYGVSISGMGHIPFGEKERLRISGVLP